MKTLSTFQTKFHDKLLVHFCTLLTLGENAERGLRSSCLSVCVSVKSHLTSGASVRRENAATHSAGNEG